MLHYCIAITVAGSAVYSQLFQLKGSIVATRGALTFLYEVMEDKNFTLTSGKRNTDYSAVSMANMNTENIYAGISSISDQVPPNEKVKKTAKRGFKSLAMFGLVAVLVVIVACFIAIFFWITELKTAEDSLQQEVMLLMLHQQLSQEHTTQLNTSLEDTATFLQMTDLQLSQDIASIRDLTQKLTMGTSGSNPTDTCAALPPYYHSGYYWVRASNGSAVHVYCDMTRSCGNITGGWTRVAELDMTNSSHRCPSSLTLRTEEDGSSIRTCVAASGADCLSIPIIIPHSYLRVCGKIIAYQVGATNAFRTLDTIDAWYLHGWC